MTYPSVIYTDHCALSVRLASSLLLQAAVSCNVSGGRVVYITTEPWQQLPKLVHGMPKPDPVLMHRVQML